MRMFMKKTLYCLFATIAIFCIIIIPSKCYAKTGNKIIIGKEIQNKSLDDDSQSYTLTLQRKMKIKFSVTVEAVEKQAPSEETDEDDYYFEDDYDEDSNFIDFRMNNDDEFYEGIIEDFEINEGETKTKTVVLEAGKYVVNIWGSKKGLKYTFNTEDKSEYTNTITMISKLRLVAGNSKKIKVKSEESGKMVGEVIWSTSNEKIAIVDTSGNVTGIKDGTCIIGAKTNNAGKVKCNITVTARPQLYITEASFNMNFLGGVEPFFTMQNNFGKTIKYIYLNCYFYNTVGDPAYCDIKNTNYQYLKITGPIKNGITDSYYWDAVIYNSTTGKMYVKTAEVIFMDGTKKTITIKKSYK